MDVENSPKGDILSIFSDFHEADDFSFLSIMNYLQSTKHPMTPKIHPLLKELVTNIENKVVLDVGCGMGSVLSTVLLNLGLKPENLYSLDLDSKNFKNYAYAGANKIVGNAEKMGFNSDFFDFVHSNELTSGNLQIDYKKTLQEICRVLKPGKIYLANEKFESSLDFVLQQIAKIVQEKIMNIYEERSIKHNTLQYLANLEQKTQEILDFIRDNRKISSIGFSSMHRIRYIVGDDAPEHQFMLYLFKKQPEYKPGIS
ncbi:class I SAM-dependent methyltransferase [Candidatus Woesearchaeota archaeon]|nr:class I SAM-dependent methyltransferase [Candidatus Woesearchaeota archaeon]